MVLWVVKQSSEEHAVSIFAVFLWDECIVTDFFVTEEFPVISVGLKEDKKGASVWYEVVSASFVRIRRRVDCNLTISTLRPAYVAQYTGFSTLNLFSLTR